MRGIREPETLNRSGLSKSTVRRLEAAGEFPPRMQLSLNCVGWPDDELNIYFDALRAGKSRKEAADIAAKIRAAAKARVQAIEEQAVA